MSVVVDSIKFQDSYTGTYSGGSDNGADFLMGCVGDFMYATINFHVSWSVLNANIDFSSANKTITLKPCGLLASDFIQAGFKKGDTIVVSGSASNNGSFFIVNITSTVITVDESLTDESSTGVNVYGITTINSIDFFYNITPNSTNIKNQSSFLSLTDPNSLQKYSGTANIYYGGYDFINPNSPSLAWFTETVDGINCRPQLTYLGTTADYKQQYSIKFPFLITPFFTSDQLSILQNALTQSLAGSSEKTTSVVVPDSFSNGNCPQFIYRIDAKYTPNQNFADHTTDSIQIKQSNISWFNQFFPSGVYDTSANFLTQTQYKLDTTVYTDQSSVVVDTIDFNKVTNVSVKIKSTNGGIAISSAKLVVNFGYISTNPDEYQDYSDANQAKFRQVFLHDRATLLTNGVSVNGDKFGSSFQAITNCSASIVGSEISISFKIDLGSASKNILSQASDSNRNYVIWVTPQSTDRANSMLTANRSAILCDVNLATTNTDDSTLLNIITNGQSDVYFYKCNTCSQISDLTSLSPETSFQDYVGAYGISFLQFQVKKGCKITNIDTSFDVKVTSTTDITTVLLGEFSIEDWNNDLTSYWDGQLTQVNISQPRSFPLSSSDLRNQRKIYRKDTLDSTNYYAYEMVYGFQLGFQYWQSKIDYYKIFNKYHTNYWAVYSQGYAGKTTDPDFVRIVPTTLTTKVYFKLVFDVLDTSTGITTQFIRYCDVNCFDEGGNQANWTLSLDTVDSFGNSMSGVISQDSPTTVQCSISAPSLATPPGTTPTGELVAYYTSGGVEKYDRVSTGDSSVLTGSIWNELPALLIDTTHNTALITAELDVNNLPLPVSNIRIYSKFTFE